MYRYVNQSGKIIRLSDRIILLHYINSFNTSMVKKTAGEKSLQYLCETSYFPIFFMSHHARNLFNLFLSLSVYLHIFYLTSITACFSLSFFCFACLSFTFPTTNAFLRLFSYTPIPLPSPYCQHSLRQLLHSSNLDIPQPAGFHRLLKTYQVLSPSTCNLTS